jgi:accessory gene regulator protein AgrB
MLEDRSRLLVSATFRRIVFWGSFYDDDIQCSFLNVLTLFFALIKFIKERQGHSLNVNTLLPTREAKIWQQICLLHTCINPFLFQHKSFTYRRLQQCTIHTKTTLQTYA